LTGGSRRSSRVPKSEIHLEIVERSVGPVRQLGIFAECVKRAERCVGVELTVYARDVAKGGGGISADPYVLVVHVRVRKLFRPRPVRAMQRQPQESERDLAGIS
jgi:hypothetical protein